LEFPGNEKPLWVTASNRKHMARVGGKIDIFTHDPSLKVVKINKPLW
jgi:hypothetical protein